MNEPRHIGEASTYDDALDVHRARLTEIGITHQTFERLLGWTGGKVGKVYGEAQVKRMTAFEFFEALEVLALKMIFVEDLEAAHKMAERWEQRVRGDVSASRQASLGKKQIRRALKPVLHEMQKRSTAAKSPAVRRRVAKRAATVRWKPKISHIRREAANARWHPKPKRKAKLAQNSPLPQATT